MWAWLTTLAVLAIVITAGYILWTLQRVFFGPQPAVRRHRGRHAGGDDPYAALVIAIMVVGIYPAVLTDVFQLGLEPIIQSLQLSGAP